MNKKVEKILSFLIVAIFSCVALGVIWILGRTILLHQTAGHWASVRAKVLNWDLVQETGRKSGSKLVVTRSKVVVNYRYRFENKDYTGQRLDFSLGADNFGDKRRQRQMDLLRQTPVQVFVNPDKPTESVVDRSLPVHQIAFGLFFLFFPCGLGTIFLWTYLFKFIKSVSGIENERFIYPLFGIMHSLPAPYALMAESPDRGLGSSLILFLFTLVLAYCSYETLLRIMNPNRGAKQLLKKPGQQRQN
jgi:hypothetical protein